MAVSETFRSLVLDQLARIAPKVCGKRMFGGLGIYSGETFFALADNDRLYLKADEQTRGQFAEQGWEPFRPFGDDRMTIQYYEAPLEVIENASRLQPWADLALAAAKRRTKSKRKPAMRTKVAAGLSKKAISPKSTATKRKGNRGLRGRRG